MKIKELTEKNMELAIQHYEKQIAEKDKIIDQWRNKFELMQQERDTWRKRAIRSQSNFK